MRQIKPFYSLAEQRTERNVIAGRVRLMSRLGWIYLSSTLQANTFPADELSTIKTVVMQINPFE